MVLTLLNFLLCFFIIALCASVSSGQTSCSQHPPGTLTRLSLAQPNKGSENSRGQRETHPTAPSMQVHWCLQLGWKVSPF